MDEVDAALGDIARAFAISDAEGRRAFASVRLRPPPNLPKDPDSPEYREAQFDLYCRISGRPRYHTDNEQSPIDVDEAIRTPFPYQTRSPEVVGDQLVAQGCLVKALPVKPPADLLEFGPGWGNTTLQFVQSGYRVTAVELDDKFCELVRRRCSAFGDQLSVVQGDMLTYRTAGEVRCRDLLRKSFHHCADHVQMLRNVRGFSALRGGAASCLRPSP